MSEAFAHEPPDDKSKATRSELDWVRGRAARAGKQLDQEQSQTVISIARAFEDISESEARAQLDTRLAMVEDQLERLLERRDEVEQAVEAELAVMRTRVEEALEAIASASESQRKAWVTVEERMASPVPPKVDVGVDELLVKGRKARQGSKEVADVVEDIEHRARKSGQEIQDDVEATVKQFRIDVKAAAQAAKVQIEKSQDAHQETAKQLTARLESKLNAGLEALEAKAAAVEELYDRALPPLTARSSEEPGPEPGQAGPGSEPEPEFSELEDKLTQAKNDLRIELHELRAWVEKTLTELGDLVEWSRSDCLMRIQASEEKASRAAVYLDALVHDLRVQQDRARREWSGMLRLIAADLVRIESRLAAQRPGSAVQYSPSAQ